MALSDDEQATLKRLNSRLRSDLRTTLGRSGKRLGFHALDAYYDGAQRLEQLGLAVPDDLRQFVTVVAWPGTHVDAIEERCDVEGFRLPGEPEADEGLWEVWQANDLDEQSQMGHVDSMVFGRSYACVGSREAGERTGDDDDTPLITVESPLEMVHEESARTRVVTTAGRFYVDESAGRKLRRSTLYLPDETVWCVMGPRGWDDEDRDQHGLGRVLVEPLTNRARLHKRYGRSEMGRTISLTDAAARALTNAQVATEVMALPQRHAAGMSQADFADPQTGEALTAWESYFGAVWVAANKDARFGQFSAGDLSNFTGIVDHYAQLVAGVTGLPMRYFGQLAQNPPSAEGIRADEARLVMTCYRKIRSWGGTWERVMRLVRLLQTGRDDPALASMETLWRNPETPTRAQTADATVKLYQAGIVSRRQARRDIGYSSVQIANMEDDDNDEAQDPVLERVARGLTGAPDAA